MYTKLLYLKSNIFAEKDKHQMLKPPAVINSYNINFLQAASKPANKKAIAIKTTGNREQQLQN